MNKILKKELLNSMSEAWSSMWQFFYGAPLKDKITSRFGLLDLLFIPFISRVSLHYMLDKSNARFARFIAACFAIPLTFINLPFLCLATVLTTLISPFLWLYKTSKGAKANEVIGTSDEDPEKETLAKDPAQPIQEVAPDLVPEQLQSTTTFSDQRSSSSSSASSGSSSSSASMLSASSTLGIDTIPRELIEQVSSYLSPHELRSAALSGKAFSLFRGSLHIRKVTQLVTHVVRGDEAKAKELIETNPALVFASVHSTAEVVDYSGRTITRMSAFQAALCAGDVQMCEMIKTEIEQAKNSEELLKTMQAQYDEIFPDGLDSHVKAQQENVFDFNPILQAILRATPAQVEAALELKGAGLTRDAHKEAKDAGDDLTLVAALNAFREDFANHSQSEKIFNPQHLLRAFELYLYEFDNFGSWDKRDLFCIQVIGFVQRYLPACDAQAFAQGLYGIVDLGEKLARSFKFRLGERSIYPLGRSAASLGFKYLADIMVIMAPRAVCSSIPSRFAAARVLENLSQTKTAGLENLYSTVLGASSFLSV